MSKKYEFGEYIAYDTQGGIRFMKAGKLIARKNVPKEAALYLEEKLSGQRGRVEPPLEATPETKESVEDLPKDSNGNEPLPRTDDAPSGANAPSVDAATESDFLERISIHTAKLEDMVNALYQRFGIYTIYLKKLPQADEINPLTGEQFTNYHMGIAYQAAIRATHNGVLTRPPELNRHMIDEGRDASANVASQFDKVPQTLGEARRANSFDFRTSVRGTQESPTHVIEHVRGEDGVVRAVQRELTGEEYTKNGAHSVHHPEEEEPLVQPNIGGKPIIRPDW